jgi:hypothetical protein
VRRLQYGWWVLIAGNLVLAGNAYAAGFYVVDESGVSADDDPVASGFAADDTGIEDTLAASDVSYHIPEKPAVVVSPNPRPIIVNQYVVINNQPAPRQRNLRAFYTSARWRCERYGFIYSSAGRCRVPAWHKVKRSHQRKTVAATRQRAQPKLRGRMHAPRQRIARPRSTRFSF